MKHKSLQEWIKVYEEKSKDKAILHKDYRLFYLANRGFMTAKPDIEGEMLVIESVCGDGAFWRDYAELRAREMGLKHIGTFCNRPIEAYIRAFGGEILAKQNINGQKRYLCQDAIGRKVIATFKCERGEGLEPEYFVTQYLDEKATTSWNFKPKNDMKGDEKNEETFSN